jgi:hypothetical protein
MGSGEEKGARAAVRRKKHGQQGGEKNMGSRDVWNEEEWKGGCKI